ncbi:MAG TPA: asparagine synthase (glutamine-hydrolyzing) [Rudaea sp.]|nr:asparagine synthase (glutamine-hydrolyzing) [Rudaea sp.]
MCGFAGFLSFGPSARDLDAAERRRILSAMGSAIAHRGPDDEQFYDDGVLSLVFRRLSIVDLSGGQQPIFNETGERFIVVNGEIYNHQSLRNQVKDRHVFRTASDSEVPLHLFEEHGADALQRVHGMFALAIWNRTDKSLFLARDRLGIKPLYVCRLAGGLLFGSEINALLVHPECPRDLDWAALGDPGAQRQSPVATYVHGIEHLAGGHFLVAKDGRVETHCYWRIDEHLGSARCGDDAAAYRREYRELLQTVTIEHLLSDVPVGLHLSGGIDSSLLAAIVATERKDLACFSVIERTSVRAGDADCARKVTDRFGLPWYPVLFDYRRMLDEMAFDLARLEQAVYMMGAPRFGAEWVLKEELHRFARTTNPRLKVVLLGQGADEFAGGYSNRLGRPNASWSDYLRDEIAPGLRKHRARNAQVPERLRGLAIGTRPYGAELGPFHMEMAQLVHQLQHYNLWHEDRSSAFQSLEARVPFLDHRVVELLASVPVSLHETLFWDKQIVRAALQHFMPEYDITHRKIPFIATDDTRSIDIMLNQMLLRTMPAFLDKYPALPCFPFDADALRTRLDRVRKRSSGFHDDCVLLIECMVVAIFDQQCRRPPLDDFRVQRERRAGPPRVALENWERVKGELGREPEAPAVDWGLNDCVAFTEGGVVLQSLGNDDRVEYVLAEREDIGASITMPRKHPWLAKFLRNLGNGSTSGFSVNDWLDEFDIDLHEFREVLDVLYQCGFVHKAAPSGAASGQAGSVPAPVA